MRDWTIATQPDRRARLQFIRARERVDALRRQVVVLAVGLQWAGRRRLSLLFFVLAPY